MKYTILKLVLQENELCLTVILKMWKFIRKKKARIMCLSKRETKLKILVTSIVECTFLWQVFGVENVQF